MKTVLFPLKGYNTSTNKFIAYEEQIKLKKNYEKIVQVVFDGYLYRLYCSE
jgi:hypothetical protein